VAVVIGVAVAVPCVAVAAACVAVAAACVVVAAVVGGEVMFTVAKGVGTVV
jgi:hypothetical protein